MAIDFPASPSTNDTHTHNGLTWTFDGTTWKINTTVQSGSTTFTGLTDTPSSYTSHGSKFVKVNSATNALEFDSAGGGVTDGDKGDITVSNSGATWNIDASTIGTTELSATGTKDATTYLRGDNTWQTISSGASVTTSDTPPSSPSDGDLWWDSQNGRLLVYYEDTDSGQWVDASGRGVNNSVTQETGTFSLTVSPSCQNAAVSTGNYVKTGKMVTVDFNVYHNGGTDGDTNLRWGGQNGYFTINDTSLRPVATAGIFYNRRYFDLAPGNTTGTLRVWVGTCGVTPNGEIYTSSSMAAGLASGYGVYYFSVSWRIA